MSRLCIVTALPAETRPWLDALKLRQSKARHLRLFGSAEYLLLETGLGKLNAAANVAALLQTHPDIGMIVNLGIAGGAFGLADILAAHHIQDQASGAQWFPHLPESKVFRGIRTASVRTLDTPDQKYCKGVLFDMEAAGVFHAASRYLSTSQIHSIKVVSDNPESDIKNINKNSVLALITQSLPDILPMLEALRELPLSAGYEHTDIIDTLIVNTTNGIHHSVNDEHLLRELVQQHIAITGKLPCIDHKASNARDIRKALQMTLAAQPFVYGDL